MKPISIFLLSLTFSIPAQAKLTMNKECARGSYPPAYTEQDLEKLEYWLDAAVALSFGERSLDVKYDKDAFMKTCPNIALFNFGRATGCVDGLARRFGDQTLSWESRLKIKTKKALKSEFKKAMEKYSDQIKVDLSTISPTEFPPSVPKKEAPAKVKPHVPEATLPGEDEPTEESNGTSAE